MGTYQLRPAEYDLGHANGDGWKLQKRDYHGRWSKVAGEAKKVEHTLVSLKSEVGGRNSKGESFLHAVNRQTETWHSLDFSDKKAAREFRQKTHEARLSIYQAHGIKLEHAEVTDEDLFLKWEKETDPDQKALWHLEIQKRLKVLKDSAELIESALEDEGRQKVRDAAEAVAKKIDGTPFGNAVRSLKRHLLSDGAWDKFTSGKEHFKELATEYGVQWRDKFAETAAMLALLKPIDLLTRAISHSPAAGEALQHILEQPMFHLAITAGASMLVTYLGTEAIKRKRAAARVLRERKAAKNAADPTQSIIQNTNAVLKKV